MTLPLKAFNKEQRSAILTDSGSTGIRSVTTPTMQSGLDPQWPPSLWTSAENAGWAEICI